jgi:hypothetical protein
MVATGNRSPVRRSGSPRFPAASRGAKRKMVVGPQLVADQLRSTAPGRDHP